MSVAVNALWPLTSICTERIKALMGPEFVKSTRKVDIMADAAYAVLIREPDELTGRFLVDDEVLTEADIPKEKIVAYINRDIPAWNSELKGRKAKKNTQREEGKISELFKKIEPLLSKNNSDLSIPHSG